VTLAVPGPVIVTDLTLDDSFAPAASFFAAANAAPRDAPSSTMVFACAVGALKNVLYSVVTCCLAVAGSDTPFGEGVGVVFPPPLLPLLQAAIVRATDAITINVESLRMDRTVALMRRVWVDLIKVLLMRPTTNLTGRHIMAPSHNDVGPTRGPLGKGWR